MAFVCSIRSATVTAIANGEEISKGFDVGNGITSAAQSISGVRNSTNNSHVEQMINSKNNGIGGRG